ncbi:putative glycoside hydrolase [Salsuginibacillus kocurii]|uniref:putative glycoside hydrolase n=1 Tax=Salsuginibacillus kocurii TaxID=427078 RepID=UPI00036FE3A5|nr:putative glycoside hydrolase [Salsuginibacillus kocurii]
MKRFTSSLLLATFATGIIVSVPYAEANEELVASAHSYKQVENNDREVPEDMSRFTYDSGYDFEYPDAVRGIFVTGHSAGGSKFDELVELTNETDLNAMVIDIKEDEGYITFRPDEDDPYYDMSQNMISDPEEMMETLEENEIYPIARIVAFKDTLLAEEKPEWSFTDNGEVWKNSRGEAFVNPLMEEVWEYNIEVAKKAAEMGFEDIQFDYVRFPEGFETRDEDLDYSRGNYEEEEDNVRARVNAINDFLAEAKEELEPYDVDVSADIFGYTATLEEAPGIGQNFAEMAEEVDVISSMPYPSHWTAHFGYDNPDLHPYEVTKEYAKLENEILEEADDPPTSRPWLQDFTAPYLGEGNYREYGAEEVEKQIRAFNEEGVDEFLLWNASNNYSEGVDYTPLD